MYLDDMVRPGLTLAQIHALLARCGCCSLVMTRRILLRHECFVNVDTEVIDLTELEDDVNN